MRRLLILGAGGHARVVADAACESGCWGEIAFLDDAYPGIASNSLGPVIGKFGDIHSVADETCDFLVAVGSNTLRLELCQKILSEGLPLVKVVHPSAVLSKHCSCGPGTVVLANSVVAAGANLGMGVIVNHLASIDHDCGVGDGVHVSPGAVLAGQVVVGRCTWIGAGAVVANGVSIGEHTTIGAGASVLQNVGDRLLAAGVPAVVKKTYK